MAHPSIATRDASAALGAAPRPGTVWLVTAGLSVLLHGFAIVVAGALVTGLGGGRLGLGRDLAGFQIEAGLPRIDADLDLGVEIVPVASAAATPDADELSTPPSAPLAVAPALPPAVVPPIHRAQPVAPDAHGDRRHLAERPAPLNSVPSPPVPPAHRENASPPDRSSDGGTRLPVWAFRHDTSTLRERLFDGADTYQPPHDHTTTHFPPASPQAVRREIEVGTGDSVRTSTLQAPPPAPNYGVADEPQPAPDGPSSETLEVEPADPTARVTVAPDRRAPDGPHFTPVESTGPLDADRGRRAFDVSGRAALATDNLNLRAASDALHPGITDLSRPHGTSPGDGDLGRGPGSAPQAASLATRGLAAAVLPKPHGVAGGTGDEDRQSARTYNRYHLELERRVRDAYAFPRDLALRMEQGETIVRFTVAPDGRLSGTAEVVKSSGFDGFDKAALDAVARALPYRPMPDQSHARPVVFSVVCRAVNPFVP